MTRAILTLSLGALLLTLVGAGAARAAGTTETPAYAVLPGPAGRAFEERLYAPTLEARTTVAGPYESAMTEGFRRLAGYIFGANRPPAPEAQGGATIAMTTPVAATALDGEGWEVAFTMPRAWTWETLPRPLDPRVRLVQAPEGRWAVRAFSGRMRTEALAQELATLQAALAAEGLAPIGPAVVDQFDPPWVPAALRTNQIRLPLPWPATPPAEGAPRGPALGGEPG